MLLMIDNYDSFTWNLVQYFAALGQQVLVKRNDDVTVAQIKQLAPQYLVISPGPGTPSEAGVSLAAIDAFAGKLPILGVCLGHQAIAQVLGAKVVRARQVMHGKNSFIQHQQTSVFKGLPSPLSVTRYHSLVVDADSLPAQVKITATTMPAADGWQDIMGLSVAEQQLHGVQFHPEAILTEHGQTMLANFLALTE
ncbi:anthranilate synthase component II [Alishewanella tabrizica]|uniref:Glutamine amidotransferase n=1 Tax=Alishewanella tabrizica TaxID=671278 RepID=A0ABQ2WEE6_9ALTE|nr:aminodeoxychorismate/anthranilate synthase component II [Alishewanella tabrizica]GGW52233.1 glutamine amidotransferase [Alishewanella tabrizica]